MTAFYGKAMVSSESGCNSFYFDLSCVMSRCEILKQNPERVALMCQAQVHRIAPNESVIPAKDGFHLVVRTRSGAAAGALASQINRALLRQLFGAAEAVAEMPPLYDTASPGNVLPFVRSSLTARRANGSNAHSNRPDVSAAAASWTDFKPGFIPVFNLRHKAPPIHLCGPVSLRQGKAVFGVDALRYCHPEYRASVDMAILKYAISLLPEACRGKEVSAIAAGVSYETLAWSRSRRSYLDMLRAACLPGNAPLIVKLDDVPRGTPTRNLADIVAWLKPLARRIFIHLPDRNTSPMATGCLGVEGFCASITPCMAAADVAALAHHLGHVATAQRALSCILRVTDNSMLRVVHEAGSSLAALHPDRGMSLGACDGELTSSTGRQAA